MARTRWPKRRQPAVQWKEISHQIGWPWERQFRGTVFKPFQIASALNNKFFLNHLSPTRSFFAYRSIIAYGPITPLWVLSTQREATRFLWLWFNRINVNTQSEGETPCRRYVSPCHSGQKGQSDNGLSRVKRRASRFDSRRLFKEIRFQKHPVGL